MEWKAWIDSKLGTNFEEKAYDPQKGRDKLVKVIDKAAEQHSEGKTPPTRTWKTGGNNAIRFIPTLNGNPIMLDEGKAAFVPAEHFQKFLTQLKASVQNGDLDKEIKTALESKGKTTSTSSRASAKGDKPYAVREGYADLSRADKQKISAFYRHGKNPDGTLISEAGHKPDAPLAS